MVWGVSTDRVFPFGTGPSELYFSTLALFAGQHSGFLCRSKEAQKVGILGTKLCVFFFCFFFFFGGGVWVNGILRKESSVYCSLCIVLLKTLKGGVI